MISGKNPTCILCGLISVKIIFGDHGHEFLYQQVNVISKRFKITWHVNYQCKYDEIYLNKMLTELPLEPVHMILGQLTDPWVNFASLHGLMPVTVHIRFLLPCGSFKRWITQQHWVTQLFKVTFFIWTERKYYPWATVLLCMLIINVQNKFHKKFQKVPGIGVHV